MCWTLNCTYMFQTFTFKRGSILSNKKALTFKVIQ
jgi:hypothetical protein